MKKLLITTILIFLLSFVSASCSSGEIDVNSASLEELQTFTGIGPVKAQAIIDTRPFEKVDDLINVYGIGEITLNNMKNQGACVEEENENSEDEIKNEKPVEEIIVVEIENNNEIVRELQTIELNSKDIKTEEDNDLDSDKSNNAIYSFIGFCVLLAFLFGFKFLKTKKYKSEFENG